MANNLSDNSDIEYEVLPNGGDEVFPVVVAKVYHHPQVEEVIPNIGTIVESSRNQDKIHISLSHEKISKTSTKETNLTQLTKFIPPQIVVIDSASDASSSSCSSFSKGQNKISIGSKLNPPKIPISMRKPLFLPPPDYSISFAERQNLLRKYSVPAVVDSTVQPQIISSRHNWATASRTSKSSQEKNTTKKFLEDKYKCYVCKNPYTDPRVLDCLHTFCFQCVYDIDENKIGIVSDLAQKNSDNSEYDFSCKFFLTHKLISIFNG